MNHVASETQTRQSISGFLQRGYSWRQSLMLMAADIATKILEIDKRAPLNASEWRTTAGRALKSVFGPTMEELINPPMSSRTADYKEVPEHNKQNLRQAQEMIASGRYNEVIVLSPAQDYNSNNSVIYVFRREGDRVIQYAITAPAEFADLGRFANNLFGISVNSDLSSDGSRFYGVAGKESATKIDANSLVQAVIKTYGPHGLEVRSEAKELISSFLGMAKEGLDPLAKFESEFNKVISQMEQHLTARGIDPSNGRSFNQPSSQGVVVGEKVLGDFVVKLLGAQDQIRNAHNQWEGHQSKFPEANAYQQTPSDWNVSTSPFYSKGTAWNSGAATGREANFNNGYSSSGGLFNQRVQRGEFFASASSSTAPNSSSRASSQYSSQNSTEPPNYKSSSYSHPRYTPNTSGSPSVTAVVERGGSRGDSFTGYGNRSFRQAVDERRMATDPLYRYLVQVSLSAEKIGRARANPGSDSFKARTNGDTSNNAIKDRRKSQVVRTEISGALARERHSAKPRELATSKKRHLIARNSSLRERSTAAGRSLASNTRYNRSIYARRNEARDNTTSARNIKNSHSRIDKAHLNAILRRLGTQSTIQALRGRLIQRLSNGIRELERSIRPLAKFTKDPALRRELKLRELTQLKRLDKKHSQNELQQSASYKARLALALIQIKQQQKLVRTLLSRLEEKRSVANLIKTIHALNKILALTRRIPKESPLRIRYEASTRAFLQEFMRVVGLLIATQSFDEHSLSTKDLLPALLLGRRQRSKREVRVRGEQNIDELVRELQHCMKRSLAAIQLGKKNKQSNKDITSLATNGEVSAITAQTESTQQAADVRHAKFLEQVVSKSS